MMMSGAIQAMMAADTQMKVMANIENLIKATMRIIRKSIPTDHLIALIALSITWHLSVSCCLL